MAGRIGFTTLASLDQFSDSQLRQCADDNPDASSLTISGTKVSDQTLKHYGEVLKPTTVIFQHLDSKGVTAKGMNGFFQNMPQVTSLVIINSFVAKCHKDVNVFEAAQKHCPHLTSLTFQTHYADNYRKASEVALKRLNDACFSQHFQNVTLLGRDISYIPSSIKSKVRHLSLRGTSVSTSDICTFLSQSSDLKSLQIGTLREISPGEINAMFQANPDIKLTINGTVRSKETRSTSFLQQLFSSIIGLAKSEFNS